MSTTGSKTGVKEYKQREKKNNVDRRIWGSTKAQQVEAKQRKASALLCVGAKLSILAIFDLTAAHNCHDSNGDSQTVVSGGECVYKTQLLLPPEWV